MYVCIIVIFIDLIYSGISITPTQPQNNIPFTHTDSHRYPSEWRKRSVPSCGDVKD